MEVKDVRAKTTLPTEPQGGGVRPPSAPDSGEGIHSDAIAVAAVHEPRNRSTSAAFQRANEAIASIVRATEAVEEIDKLAKSVEGIVDQVASTPLPPSRRQALEDEANDLVKEIRSIAQTRTSDGSRPLAGDPISVEIDDPLLPVINIVLPDDAKDAFGIGVVQFSPRDAILDTRANVIAARERIEYLRRAVFESSNSLINAVSSAEVSRQNTEAATSSVRDLDKALDVLSLTKAGIAANPQLALATQSARLDSGALVLLRT